MIHMEPKIGKIERRGKWLIVHFPEPQAVLSWAVVRGARNRACRVAWYQVAREELTPSVHPAEFLRQRLEEDSLFEAVGLLTSTNLDRYATAERSAEGVTVSAVATVGMSNALRIGDPIPLSYSVGTINLLCQISMPVSEEALVEALSLATEARTAAVLEAGIKSIESGQPATGTGTDCIVLAAPESPEAVSYAGKHTVIGHLIGTCVGEVIRSGLKGWRETIVEGDPKK